MVIGNHIYNSPQSYLWNGVGAHCREAVLQFATGELDRKIFRSTSGETASIIINQVRNKSARGIINSNMSLNRDFVERFIKENDL